MKASSTEILFSGEIDRVVVGEQIRVHVRLKVQLRLIERQAAHEAIRSIALTTAARTLLWGGCAFSLFGLFALAFPDLADVGIATPLHIHNLDTLGLPFALVVFTVIGIGATSFVSATQNWRRRLLTESARVDASPTNHDASPR
jgi:hypothetical protein